MRSARVLFYADMEAIIPHCVAAAEMLRRQLDAHIIMVVADRRTYYDKAFENYEVYDHKSLLQLSGRFVPIEFVARQGINTGSASAGVVGDVSPSNGANAPYRIELFGLRKSLSRYYALKKIYTAPRILKSWAMYSLKRSPVGLLIGQSLHFWRRGLGIKRFLRAIQPDIIILAEDNVERLTTSFVNEGRRHGIPSIIIPFTIPNPLEPAKAYRDRRPHQIRGPLAWIVSTLYPKWRFRLDGQDLLRVPAFTALVLEMLGQSSSAPWILNRGGAAMIVLDSEAQRDIYLTLGFPPRQLSVVGDVNGEILQQGLMNKPRLLAGLIAEHGLQTGRPLILCGFPPDQFGSKTNDFEFSDYDALIEGWMESFRALGDRANILVRPHPRVARDRFKAFRGSNVRFTWQPTAELIPLCDLYVASISATIRWAISCGIPVINYDTYRYRYGDYDKAGGVVRTESLTDFRYHLARFVNEPSFAADLTERQRGEMQRWGVANDKLAERFAAVVSSVIVANSRASSTA
jgi:hypothetical protein